MQVNRRQCSVTLVDCHSYTTPLYRHHNRWRVKQIASPSQVQVHEGLLLETSPRSRGLDARDKSQSWKNRIFRHFLLLKICILLASREQRHESSTIALLSQTQLHVGLHLSPHVP